MVDNAFFFFLVDSAYDKISNHSHSFYIYKALFKYNQSDILMLVLNRDVPKLILILEKAFSAVIGNGLEYQKGFSFSSFIINFCGHVTFLILVTASFFKNDNLFFKKIFYGCRFIYNVVLIFLLTAK